MTDRRYQSITQLHDQANTPEERVAMTHDVLDDLAATGKALDPPN